MVILGNGFDLHHGLPTSFKHFRDYLVEKEKVDLVNEIDGIVGSGDIDLGYKWNEYERMLRNKYIELRKNKFDGYDDKLEEINEDFVIEFQKYLNKLDISDIKINEKIKRELSQADYIISLNYTTLYENYGILSDDVIHLHGKAKKGDLPIIGFHDGVILNEIKPKSSYKVQFEDNLIHKSALAYKQNLRDLEKEISSILVRNQSKLEELIVIGYSFGKCDYHICNMIGRLCKTYIVNSSISTLEYEELEKTKIKIFDYNGDSEQIMKSIHEHIKFMGSTVSTKVYGKTIRPEEKSMFEFEILKY